MYVCMYSRVGIVPEKIQLAVALNSRICMKMIDTIIGPRA